MLQMSSMLFQALKVVFDKPQGQARGYTNTFYHAVILNLESVQKMH